MTAAEISAFGALLVSVATFAKVILEGRRMARKQDEQLVDRRTQVASRLGDVVFERLQRELERVDRKLDACEQQHQEDQRRITELEQTRAKREVQLQDLASRISAVDSKVDLLQTGVFQKFDRGDFHDPR